MSNEHPKYWPYTKEQQEIIQLVHETSPETNRRLVKLEDLPEKVGDINADIKVITKIQEKILSQVTYTNGRVRWLEKMIYLALGALIILTPICTWFIKDYIDFKQSYRSDLSDTIYDVLDHYQFELTE